MTSTDIYQGMDVGSKTSSRVLNPPGGRSNNIFGTAEEAPAPTRQKPAQSSSVQIGAPAQSAKPRMESPASNSNQVNPITNQVSSPAASNTESPSRVSRVNVQKKTPEQLPAAGAPASGAWETSHRQRSNPPGGKSSIIF